MGFKILSNETAELGNGANDKVIKKIEKKLGLKFGKEYYEFLSKYGNLELTSDNYAYEIYGIVTGSSLEGIPNIVNPTISEREFVGDNADIANKALILEPGNGDSVWIDSNDNIFYYEHDTSNLIDEKIKFNNYLVTLGEEEIVNVQGIGLLFLPKYSGWLRKDIIDFGKKQYIVDIVFSGKNSKESLTNPVSDSQMKLFNNTGKLFSKNQKKIFEKMVDWEYDFIIDAGINVNKKNIKITDFTPVRVTYDDYYNRIIVEFNSKYDTEHGIAFTINVDDTIEVGKGSGFY